ncbi:hypothetical protein ALP93_101729 [Pseudomonas syringae pv. helianthi]|nr:hypothetical protein ALP93_101729 [Pseudomonas syringae pv. helianthi]
MTASRRRPSRSFMTRHRFRTPARSMIRAVGDSRISSTRLTTTSTMAATCFRTMIRLCEHAVVAPHAPEQTTIVPHAPAWNALGGAPRHRSAPRRLFKIGRGASRNACDAERRTIVEAQFRSQAGILGADSHSGSL